jgi:hypothetical protein
VLEVKMRFDLSKPIRRAGAHASRQEDGMSSSVVSSQPARPAALGCVGLIKKPGWLFGLL